MARKRKETKEPQPQITADKSSNLSFTACLKIVWI